MIEHPVKVTIGLPRGGRVPLLGGAFSLRSTSCDVPSPAGLSSLYLTGFLGIYLREHRGEVDPWLVLSADLDTPRPTSSDPHAAFLHRSEEGHPHLCRWYGPVPIDLLWNTGGRLSYIRSSVPRAVMASIWETEGEPEGRGSWLSSRLLPRLSRGAVRYDHPILQLWTPLL